MKKYSIGIDLGGTKILVALVNRESGEVVHFVKKKTKKDKNRYFEATENNHKRQLPFLRWREEVGVFRTASVIYCYSTNRLKA